jgi:hypothetical protein
VRPVPAPPKDDRTREALLQENERLKRELLRKRADSPMWPVVLGFVVHLVLRPLFDPWLNASSDAKVAAAVVILTLPVVFALVMLARALRRRPD